MWGNQTRSKASAVMRRHPAFLNTTRRRETGSCGNTVLHWHRQGAQRTARLNTLHLVSLKPTVARKRFGHQNRKSRFHFHIFFRFCHSWSLTLLKMSKYKHTLQVFFLKVPLTFINVHIIIIITIKNIIWQIANCCRHNQQQHSSPASIPWENKT